MRRVSAILDFLPREGRLWLLAAIGLLLAGWAKGINLLMLLAYLMLALWLVNLVSAFRQVGNLSGRREPSGLFFAGEPSTWDVELTNNRHRASSGWRIEDTGAEHDRSWFLDRIDGGKTIRLQSRAVFTRRGRYRAEALVARCLHPFGLVQRTRKLADAESWIVLPALGRLNVDHFRHWLTRQARSEGRLLRTSRPSMVHQDDLHGLRPFRPGDSARWIHWRTSARRNQKMVREFEESSGQNLILIVDPWGPDGHLPALDHALSLAATVCWEWSRHGHDQLFFAIAAREPVLIAGSETREKSLLMLRALALTEGESVPDLEPLLRAMAHKVVPDAPVVVVSPRPNSPLVARLAATWNRRVIALHLSDTTAFYEKPAVPTAESVATPP